jgi:hypothetical protein
MLSSQELLKHERIAGERCVHRSDTTRCVDSECLTVAATQNLDVLSTRYEVVVHRIDRKQDTDAAVWFGM